MRSAATAIGILGSVWMLGVAAFTGLGANTSTSAIGAGVMALVGFVCLFASGMIPRKPRPAGATLLIVGAAILLVAHSWAALAMVGAAMVGGLLAVMSPAATPGAFSKGQGG